MDRSARILSAVLVFMLSLAIALAAASALAAPPEGRGGGRDKTPRNSPGGKKAQTCETEQVAPTISGTPDSTATEGLAYAFQPAAEDRNCDPLTFSISGKPYWASFDSARGRLSGTPPEGAAGSYRNISIAVSDGLSSTALPQFAIEVHSANRAPQITGTPDTAAQVDLPWEFRPRASDPDGDPLSFSVSGRPAWARFDGATGRLWGTPGAADVGNYPDIVISVSDGRTMASLAAFGLTVEAASNGSATLYWQPPAQRADGTPLTNLSGYRIRYGTSEGSYPNVITLNNPGLSSHMVENLPPASWFFVMTAFDGAGLESAATAPVSKQVR